MQVEVLNIKGEKTGRSVELPNEYFGVTPNDHLLFLAVKQYLAASHQGTHKVKTRAEVKGASRKLHKQKGTGGARKGNIRNPLYKGGGTIFGPKPHRYHIKLNKQVKNLAFYSALSYKAQENSIFVLEDMQLETPSTSTFAQMLTCLNLTGKKTLFLLPEQNENVYKSARNIPKVKADVFYNTNTYDVLNAQSLILTENVVKQFVENETEVEA